jgi:TonB family protein
MPAFWAIALFVLASASASISQQATPPAPSHATDAPAERVKVYAIGPDVTAPLLLPHDFTKDLAKECRTKMDGTVLLSFLVDTAGLPHHAIFLRPLGTDLDPLALSIIAADRFSPGTRNGTPVVVGQTVEVAMQGCDAETKDNAGKTFYTLKLRSIPAQKFGILPQPQLNTILGPDTFRVLRVGGEVSAPELLNHIDVEFSEEARRAKFQGICVLALIVDAHGLPEYVRVVWPLGKGLDEKAIEAVRKYRFTPAMKDGAPVPVIINVEVNFSLYQ